MLRTALLLILFNISLAGYAQGTIQAPRQYASETIEVTDKAPQGITEKYHVLKNAHNIKHGIYLAITKKNVVIASGLYEQGKRIGTWHFYNSIGKLVQHYNYDKANLGYVADEDPTHNVLMYEFVPKPADTAMVSVPVNIGGLLYGYLPYIKHFKVKDASLYDPGSIYGVLQILISPIGRMAECKLQVYKEIYINAIPHPQIFDSYLLNNDLLEEDDKKFVPAVVSKQNTASTIYVYCSIANNGSIRIVD